MNARVWVPLGGSQGQLAFLSSVPVSPFPSFMKVVLSLLVSSFLLSSLQLSASRPNPHSPHHPFSFVHEGGAFATRIVFSSLFFSASRPNPHSPHHPFSRRPTRPTRPGSLGLRAGPRLILSCPPSVPPSPQPTPSSPFCPMGKACMCWSINPPPHAPPHQSTHHILPHCTTHRTTHHHTPPHTTTPPQAWTTTATFT